ncbi:peptidylprolyl isomerase [Erysipelothrix amsterdamensis]|uniref:Peptidyl-prolyl cis-trans isomerase n=1 Tax=Erysipelothrix amsterdamensis TaxID=2929157 RepID=A0AAU9VK56_9FIRM|nr:peptidylprolyl isomerase [Erysipelothrix rhusiopathiae]CAH2762289.1 peptidylprolyl isomerase [Erysipelothrix sp. A18Y020d]AGN23981.1 peptidyl-prolyl cis-trans isomerase [Erysipelothrix rhusiopathiae SY1027]MDE8032753.1 peptidylprolyl isomerase [Erysipelothrix rhusiopathiae]MDE8036974.1 peptidylprolyl isomerase [Erysipelothrix rhusiopathiae]MDE8039299.1 peptidylprolyl isomerase [Erysipelothrix rhusiopathiae]
MKKIKTLIAISFFVLISLTGCSQTKEQPKPDPSSEVQDFSKDTNPIVTIEMEDGGIIKLELYPDIAPNTVNNFIKLVEDSFYDGLLFHRVIPGFMIQGGDPKGTGTGGPGYTIKGEFSQNNFDNPISHKRGIISMARSKGNDTAGSQFFIVTTDAPHLDGSYAAFGNVVEGMDTVDRIVSVDTNQDNRPVDGKEQVMKRVTVDTKGKTYTNPNQN